MTLLCHFLCVAFGKSTHSLGASVCSEVEPFACRSLVKVLCVKAPYCDGNDLIKIRA